MIMDLDTHETKRENKEELIMKKQYETPKAEKYEFDFQENIVASAGWKGHDNQGCFKGSDGYVHDNCVYKD